MAYLDGIEADKISRIFTGNFHEHQTIMMVDFKDNKTIKVRNSEGEDLLEDETFENFYRNNSHAKIIQNYGQFGSVEEIPFVYMLTYELGFYMTVTENRKLKIGDAITLEHQQFLCDYTILSNMTNKVLFERIQIKVDTKRLYAVKTFVNINHDMKQQIKFDGFYTIRPTVISIYYGIISGSIQKTTRFGSEPVKHFVKGYHDFDLKLTFPEIKSESQEDIRITTFELNLNTFIFVYDIYQDGQLVSTYRGKTFWDKEPYTDHDPITHDYKNIIAINKLNKSFSFKDKEKNTDDWKWTYYYQDSEYKTSEFETILNVSGNNHTYLLKNKISEINSISDKEDFYNKNIKGNNYTKITPIENLEKTVFVPSSLSEEPIIIDDGGFLTYIYDTMSPLHFITDHPPFRIS